LAKGNDMCINQASEAAVIGNNRPASPPSQDTASSSSTKPFAQETMGTTETTESSTKKEYMRRPRFYFKSGKLEWGYHGILGMLCLVMNFVSLYTLKPHHILVLQVLIHLQCRDAFKMIALSPSFTPIFDVKWPWGGVTKIAAEHKPAFSLTIDVLHYVTVRVISQCLQGFVAHNQDHVNAVFWTLYVAQMWRCWRLNPLHIYPFKKFLTHFQPWLLLVPMGLGVTLDAVQLLIGEDRLDMTTLLQIQALCLVLAFLFTMAFRKYVSMVFIFCLSIVIIWGITLYVWKLLLETVADATELYALHMETTKGLANFVLDDGEQSTDAGLRSLIQDNISAVVGMGQGKLQESIKETVQFNSEL
jgi:hypothetical protein